MINQDSFVNKIVKDKLSDIRIAIPARVESVENLKDGFIDVQPIVNFTHKLTKETSQEGIIRRVRVIYPSTKTTSICFPISQGDTVDLVFHSVNLSTFLNGNTSPHDPMFKSLFNRTDCVAYVGFEPYQKSCMNPNNYRNDFDNQDLNIVHNKNTDNEVILELTSEGELKIKSPQKVFVESPEVHVEADNVTVDAQTVDAKNSVVKTSNDVEIKGKSVYQFMTTHTHSGVQSGNSNTAPPNPI